MAHTDATTKPHKGRGYWQKHVSTWEACGGTQSHYCHQHNLPEKLFSLWKNKFIKERNPEPKAEVDFVPVSTIGNMPAKNDVDHVVITLPNGIRLDMLGSSPGGVIVELAKHLMVLSC